MVFEITLLTLYKLTDSALDNFKNREYKKVSVKRTHLVIQYFSIPILISISIIGVWVGSEPNFDGFKPTWKLFFCIPPWPSVLLLRILLIRLVILIRLVLLIRLILLIRLVWWGYYVWRVLCRPILFHWRSPLPWRPICNITISLTSLITSSLTSLTSLSPIWIVASVLTQCNWI